MAQLRLIPPFASFIGLLLCLLLCLPLSGCGNGGDASIDPITPQSVAVGETIRVPLTAQGAEASYTWGFTPPELPGFDRVASISGNGTGGGLFVWSPLSSHTGSHEVQILLLNGDSVVDTQNLVVQVIPAADAAPIFVSPGPGNTYDLERDPCVTFDVEVRDDDSSNVTIRARGSLPEGARLSPIGDKRAEFEWCPEPDQRAATERWTIGLEADDGDHEATAHNFVIVLRAGQKEGCPGEEPTIQVLAPAEGARVENRGGYLVEVQVNDDMGLRDTPILYYSTSTPDDPEKPDVTQPEFEQIQFVDDGGSYRARVPSLGLAEGTEQQVYFLVSATDNDDPGGALCDHRVDSALFSFTALGGSSGGLGTCEPCSSSADCTSGVCAVAAAGARCLPTCDDGCVEGSCDSRTRFEGSIVQACGPVSTLCGGGGGGGGGMCTDDGREPNDSISAAGMAPASITDGQICASNDDYFRINAATGTNVTVTVDGFIHTEGDIDLQLLAAGGTILDVSAGVTNSESVSYCVPSASAVYARVFGYGDGENRYSMSVATSPGTCCTDDGGEEDDTRGTARAISGSDFSGTICPDDDDYLRFTVTEPTGVDISLDFVHDQGDLDLELYAPDGTILEYSYGTGNQEVIQADLFTPGTYVIRIDGWYDGFGDYTGALRFTSFSGCVSSAECTAGQVCDAGECRSDACTSDTDCPMNHACPPPGPAATVSHCGQRCNTNSECKSSEACKWFDGGRFCGARGSGQNGDACSDFSSCGGQRACLDWPGGYCARAGCTRTADCETGTHCVVEDGLGVCALDCWEGDWVCRSGYRCGIRDDSNDYLRYVCVPQ